MSDEEWKNYQRNLNNLIEKIAILMKNNSPNSKQVQKLILKHFKLMEIINPLSFQSYIELANLYNEHEEFITFFDNYNEGLADFLSQAMIFFAESKK